jgi:cytoskeleton protein RodZ
MQMQPLGSSLRGERERRRITLEDVSSTTKIRISYLEAIEQDRLDELPGGVIGRGFVRAYARAVGIDEKGTVAAYLANRSEGEAPLVLPEPRRVVKRPRNLAARLPSRAFVAGFLATGIGFVILGTLRNQYLSLLDSSATQNISTESSAAPSRTLETKGSFRTERSQAGKELPPQSVAADPLLQRGDSPIISSASAVQTDGLTLVINVRRDAWLSIFADGRDIVTGTLVAPIKRMVRAHNEIVIRVGNIGGVDFTFNGRQLPSQGGYGEARTLRFDSNGLMPPTSTIASPNPSTVGSAVPLVAMPQTRQE